MQTLVYTGSGPYRVEWQDRPGLAVQGDGEAIVRPIASTSCDLDRRIVAGNSPFSRTPGFALGHECVAEVIAVGDAVDRIRIGDVVVVPWHISCGVCARCRGGLPAHCEAMPGGLAPYGVPISGEHGGLFSEEVRVPYADAMLVVVPAGLDPVALASASDNLTDAFIAVEHGLHKHPRGAVLVVGGCESLGLFAVDHALAQGARVVDYVDGDEARRAAATGLGASARTEVGGDRYDVLVFASRNPADFTPAIKALAPAGHLSVLSMFFGEVALPMWEMYLRGVSVSLGLPNSGARVREVLALAARGAIRPRRLMTIHGFDEAPAALSSREIKPVFTRPPRRSPSP